MEVCFHTLATSTSDSVVYQGRTVTSKKVASILNRRVPSPHALQSWGAFAEVTTNFVRYEAIAFADFGFSRSEPEELEKSRANTLVGPT